MRTVEQVRSDIGAKIVALMDQKNMDFLMNTVVPKPMETDQSIYKNPKLTSQFLGLQSYNQVPDELYIAAAEMLIYVYDNEELANMQSQFYGKANA